MQTVLNKSPSAPLPPKAPNAKPPAWLIVSQIILDALNEIKMAYPKVTSKRQRELKSIRKLMAK
jgi:hypothetical protein